MAILSSEIRIHHERLQIIEREKLSYGFVTKIIYLAVILDRLLRYTGKNEENQWKRSTMGDVLPLGMGEINVLFLMDMESFETFLPRCSVVDSMHLPLDANVADERMRRLSLRNRHVWGYVRAVRLNFSFLRDTKQKRRGRWFESI